MVVVGRDNVVVGLTGLLDNKMSGVLFGQNTGRNNGVSRMASFHC